MVGFSSSDFLSVIPIQTHARQSPWPISKELSKLPLKKADLADNMDFKRIPEPTERDFARLQKYHRAWRRLRDEV